MAQGFVLHDEISETVKDGAAAVDLDAHKNVRAVGGESIRACVDASMGEVLNKLRLLRDLRPLLRGEPALADHVLIVQAHDYPIGLAARFADLAQIFRYIIFIAGCADIESVAQLITVAAVVILDRVGGADFRSRVKAMIDAAQVVGALLAWVALAAFFSGATAAESGAEVLESGEGCLVDDEGGFEAQSIHSRLAAKIDSLVSGAVLR